MPDYTVKQGECTSSIAEKNGFFWETIWNHSNNSELQQSRTDPNVLLPGDVIHIPDKEEKEEDGATETCHRFRKKGVPGKLRLRLTGRPQDEDPVEQVSGQTGEYTEIEATQPEPEPQANVPYRLFIDGQLIAEGESDDEGYVEEPISPTARRGRLVLFSGTPQERTIDLNLGHMDPVENVSGVCKRLYNLGFQCPVDADELTPEVEAALQAFQRQEGLEVTGQMDEQTCSRLQEMHGG